MAQPSPVVAKPVPVSRNLNDLAWGFQDLGAERRADLPHDESDAEQDRHPAGAEHLATRSSAGSLKAVEMQ